MNVAECVWPVRRNENLANANCVLSDIFYFKKKAQFSVYIQSTLSQLHL